MKTMGWMNFLRSFFEFLKFTKKILSVYKKNSSM